MLSMPTHPLPADQAGLPPVAERFCRYVGIDTQSDPESTTVPTTARQHDLLRLLADELVAAGAADVEHTGSGYVYATLPAPVATPGVPVIGLVAHVDTSPDAPGAGVQPMFHPGYDGGRVAFPAAPNLVLDPDVSPALLRAVGHDLLTSDGTTLLGSDDKAGVAILVQLAADLLREEADAFARGERPAPRPELRLLFTPDEEVGRGVDHVDLARFGADVAYTLDGSDVDRLNVETFHAAEARVTIEGVGVHPGYAKGLLVNALRVAAGFVAALPADEAPETTDGRAGYLHPHHLTGTTEHAEVRVLLRDFDLGEMARKEALVTALAASLEAQWPGCSISVEVTQTYANMLDHIRAGDERVVSVAYEAAEAMGLSLLTEPIRGGTDGSRLSALGIPTPNVFTGGHKFHSVREWNSVQNLERALAYTHALVHAWGRQSGEVSVGDSAETDGGGHPAA